MGPVCRNGSGMDQKQVRIFRNGSGMDPDYQKWDPINRNGSGMDQKSETSPYLQKWVMQTCISLFRPIFIHGKYVLRVCFESFFTRIISSLKQTGVPRVLHDYYSLNIFMCKYYFLCVCVHHLFLF